jgi:hypothetical protein
LTVLWLLRRGRDGVDGVVVDPTRVAFVALVYERSFSPLEQADAPPSPAPPAATNGYVFRATEKRLVHCGRKSLAPVDGAALRLVAGSRALLHGLHDVRVQRLDASTSGKLVWSSGDLLRFEAVKERDPMLWLNPAVTATLAVEDGRCVVSDGDTNVTLEPGDPSVIRETEGDWSLDEYLEELRRLEPGLPETDDQTRAEVAMSLALKEGERVRVYVRLWAIYHGPVRLAESGGLREQARMAQWRGADDAIALTEQYLKLIPEDEAMQRSLARLKARAEAGVTRFVVRGKVALPAGADPKGRPPVVAAHREGDPPTHAAAHTYAVDGRYELPLDGGSYTLQCSVPGFKLKSVPIELDADEDVDIVFTEQDKR